MDDSKNYVRSEAVELPSRALNTDSLTNWRLVPVKYTDADGCVRPGITPDMVHAFWRAYEDAGQRHGHTESTFAGWHALIEAAPRRPETSPLYRAIEKLRQYVQIRFSLSPEHIKDGSEYQCVELNDLWRVLLAADATWGTEWSRSYVEKMEALRARESTPSEGRLSSSSAREAQRSGATEPNQGGDQ